MKKITIVLTILFITINCFSQVPHWAWAKSAGGTNHDQSKICATDNNGNIIVAGNFQSSSISFGTTTLTNAGSNDIFIVKYDPNGNVLWAKSAGAAGNDYVGGCSTDASGNIIVTGWFMNSSITFGTTTLTNAVGGWDDIFIVKYDPNGNVIWAKREGGSQNDNAYSCSTDASGNIIVTGYYMSSITFGTTTLTNAGSDEMFVVKYDINGNVLWAKRAGGSGNEYARSCSTDASGNIFVTGDFTSTSITFGTTTLTNAGNADMFTVKYDSNGNVLWAKRAGGTANEYSQCCSTDASGNIIVTGEFTSSSISFGTNTLANAGTWDMFIVKYDPNGNSLWAKRAGGPSWEQAYGCSTDANGNIIVTGYFNGSSLIFGTDTLINTGSFNIFIVKCDPIGNVVWAISAGGTYTDFARSCSTDANGNIFVTGDFGSSTISFGNDTLVNTIPTVQDMFVAKLDSTGATTVGISEIDNRNSISIYPNPFTSLTNISFSEDQKHTTIKIIDVLGNEIRNYESGIRNEKSLTLDLTGYAKGIYFVRITDEKKNVINKKIIVQ